MLAIEKQVTSYEISMKLKELGVPQGQSYFVWFKGALDLKPNVEPRWSINESNLDTILLEQGKIGILCDAYTLSELISFFKNINECEYFSGDLELITCDSIAERILVKIEYEELNPQDIKL